jgi:hypothetical protein
VEVGFDNFAGRMSHVSQLLGKLVGREEADAWPRKLVTDDKSVRLAIVFDFLERFSHRQSTFLDNALH